MSAWSCYCLFWRTVEALRQVLRNWKDGAMWLNPDSDWNGFQPVQYLLDRTKVLSLPFTRVKTNGSKWIEAGDMTLGSVLLEGANRHIRTMEPWRLKDGIATQDDAEEMIVASVAFNCQLLETLVAATANDVQRRPIQKRSKGCTSWSPTEQVRRCQPRHGFAFCPCRNRSDSTRANPRRVFAGSLRRRQRRTKR